MLCLHGGGYTGLSWALLARRLKGGCRVVAPDLRCHGLTQALDEADWSAATLAGDVVALWLAMFGGGGSSSGSSGSSSGSGNGSGGSSSGSSGLAQGVQQQQQQQQQQRPAAVGGAAAAAGAGAGSPPPTVLVGHSMGGAIAVHAAALGGARGRLASSNRGSSTAGQEGSCLRHAALTQGFYCSCLFLSHLFSASPGCLQASRALQASW